LELDNFRCFKSLRLNDVRRFNVITGASGSGKTALLEAIFVAGGNSAEIYLRAGAWRGSEELRIPSNEGLVPLFEDFFHQFNLDIVVRISFTDSNRGQRTARLVAEKSETLTLPFEGARPDDSIIARKMRVFWDLPEGTHEALIEATSEGIKMSRLPSAYFMVFLNPQTSFSNRDNASRFSDLSEKNKEDQVLIAVQRLFREVKSLTVLTPKGGVPAIWCQYLGIDRKIPVALISQGINKFISIILAIASAPHGAVLIDEIENGMYYKLFPEMWRTIVEAAEDTHTQLFVTTHSREFLEAIAPIVSKDDQNYSLIRMARLGGEAEVVSSPGKEFASAIESGFDVR